MQVEWDGRPLVALERRPITFLELGYDWDAAGHTLFARVLKFGEDPDDAVDVELVAVPGESDQAKMEADDTRATFTVRSHYSLTLMATDGVDEFTLSQEPYIFEVK